MNEAVSAWGIVRRLSWADALLVEGVLVLAWVIAAMLRWALRHVAERAPARLRLMTLRLLPALTMVPDTKVGHQS